jgi:hypothetical protein
MSDLIAAPVARRAFVVGIAGAAVAPTALAAMNQQDPIFAATSRGHRWRLCNYRSSHEP